MRNFARKIDGGSVMTTIEHGGESFKINKERFLANLGDWNETWVDYVRQIEGITDLTDEHWQVVNSLQAYYRENGDVAPMRLVSKTTGFPLKRIYEMFPSGPGKGAGKMAGLPKDC